ncbi:hypothetical protein NXS98_07495 [Fontisphaera persica]|uniref:hypothetical protein n=1 Tax=Fontisphaera persica TaxID=2974023 RepID=UPI0024BFE275|nr:hypothetical protein [Fontisphaera persica]WCJ60954.1 hypothetical protein NXS98_07495 [Fontisphaera persica]
MTNAAGAVWLGVTNIAVLNQPTNDLLRTNFGRLFVPPYNESLQYDADGNLQSDGQWSYVWDAENRLIAQETAMAAVARGAAAEAGVWLRWAGAAGEQGGEQLGEWGVGAGVWAAVCV